MPAERAEKLTKGYVLRRDQIDSIDELSADRPDSSASDIVREVLDLGLPIYRERQRRIKEIDAERVPA